MIMKDLKIYEYLKTPPQNSHDAKASDGGGETFSATRGGRHFTFGKIFSTSPGVEAVRWEVFSWGSNLTNSKEKMERVCNEDPLDHKHDQT